jgi:hypothetical protein
MDRGYVQAGLLSREINEINEIEVPTFLSRKATLLVALCAAVWVVLPRKFHFSRGSSYPRARFQILC